MILEANQPEGWGYRRAYVDARYDKTYKITRAELEYLADRVQKLKTITRRVCKKRIKAFAEA